MAGMCFVGLLRSFFFSSDLLISLGYAVRGSPNRDTVTVKSASSSDQNEKSRRVKFQDSSKTTPALTKVVSNQGGSAGRQLVPGLLLVQQDSKGKYYRESIDAFVIIEMVVSVNTTPKCTNNPEITKTADSLDACPASPIDDSVGKNNLNVSTGSTDSGLSSDGVRPTDQLTYLAQILGFKVSCPEFRFFGCFDFGERYPVIQGSSDY